MRGGTSESLQLDLAPECPWRGKANHILRCIIPSALTIVLSGCGAQLPDCLSGLEGGDEPNSTAAANKPLKVGKQVLIGIDGSGSMLGYSQASKNVWQRFLQSIN